MINAKVYLNELDYCVKYKLKAKYYIRYVDEFVILHENNKVLEDCKIKIEKYLMNLRLELHKDKSKIFPMYKGVNFLGFKIFYHYKLARKRNVIQFLKRLKKLENMYCNGEISREKVVESVEGWFAYVMWGNTFKLRGKLAEDVKKILSKNVRFYRHPKFERQSTLNF